MSCNKKHSDSHRNGNDVSPEEMTSCCHCRCMSDDDFEPEMTVYHGSNCNGFNHKEDDRKHDCECCCCCPSHTEECSICEQQMKYVLSQLVTLYPDKTFEFNMEESTSVTGKLKAVVTPMNKGLVQVDISSTATPDLVYLNICRIASFRIISATYNTSILYLSSHPHPEFCGCEESIRAVLATATTVLLSAGGEGLGVSTILANPLGIVALRTGENIQFVSACQIEKIKINPDV